MATGTTSGAFMLASPASAVRELFADVVLRCRQTGGQSELIALAWALRNRAGGANVTTESEAGDVGRALLADIGIEPQPEGHPANGNGHAASWHDQTDFQQALACVSLVFDGLLPDPTHGASRVHPHDQAPAWANDFEPTALIGPLMFLREQSDSDDHPDHSATS